MAFPDQDADAQVRGPFWAKVHDNVDPQGVGRVRALIPGLADTPTDWLSPVGLPGGGSFLFGLFCVPAVGATILVDFVQGDPNDGVFWPGPWPTNRLSEIPTLVPFARAGENHKIPRRLTVQVGNFVLELDAHDNRAVLQDIRNGNMFELDGNTNAVTLRATHLAIDVDGVVDIRSKTQVQIQGRQVMPLGGPI